MLKMLVVSASILFCFGPLAPQAQAQDYGNLNWEINQFNQQMATDDIKIAAEYAALQQEIKMVKLEVLVARAETSHWTMRKFTLKTLKALGYPQLKRCEALPNELSVRQKIERQLLRNGFYKRTHLSIQVSICVLSAPFHRLGRGTVFAAVSWPGPAKLGHGYWSKPVQCHRIRHEVRIEARGILKILLKEHPQPQVIVLIPCHWVAPGKLLKIRPYLFAGYDDRAAKKVISKASLHVIFRFASCLRIYHYWTTSEKTISHTQIVPQGGGFTTYQNVIKTRRHSLWHGFEGMFQTHLNQSRSEFWLNTYQVAVRTGFREALYVSAKKLATAVGGKNSHF